jgi:hypothetical protein
MAGEFEALVLSDWNSPLPDHQRDYLGFTVSCDERIREEDVDEMLMSPSQGMWQTLGGARKA